jgi:DNA-binding LytR/AlgR family response regulator
MLCRALLRAPSFWLLQSIGWCCLGLASLLMVLPYVRQPWELGYPNLETLFTDQLVMWFGIFFATLGLRPVCRSLLQRSLPWFQLQLRALSWSLVVGTASTLAISRLITATPEHIEMLEACLKASAILYLWCNLYFSIKVQQHSQSHSLAEVAVTLQPDAHKPDSLDAKQLDSNTGCYASRFSIRSGSRLLIVGVNDVEWISAAGDYSELHTCTGTHLLRETMKSLEQRLDPTRFARIHRSRIVCLPRILELRSIENREYIVKLSDGTHHRCSRTYASRISSWLRDNH